MMILNNSVLIDNEECIDLRKEFSWLIGNDEEVFQGLLENYINQRQKVNDKDIENQILRVLTDDKKDYENYMHFLKNRDSKQKLFLIFNGLNISNKEMYDILKKYEGESFTKRVYLRINNGEEKIPYAKFMKMMEKLNPLEEKIKNDASPLEKILLAYDSAKSRIYKNNKEEEKTLKSRLLSDVLTNKDEYIVCVGFVKIFNEILRDNDLNGMDYYFTFKVENDKNNHGHAVSLVYVDDDKYDIHGLYFFDVTADSYDEKLSSLENASKYKGFLLTLDEFKERYHVLNDEFYNVLNNDPRKNKLLEKKYELEAQKKFISFMDRYDEYDDVSKFVEFDRLFPKTTYLNVYENQVMQRAYVYNYGEYLKTQMGKKINSDETFLDLIINTNKDNKNTIQVLKKVLNRGVSSGKEKEATDKVLRKLR